MNFEGFSTSAGVTYVLLKVPAGEYPSVERQLSDERSELDVLASVVGRLQHEAKTRGKVRGRLTFGRRGK